MKQDLLLMFACFFLGLGIGIQYVPCAVPSTFDFSLKAYYKRASLRSERRDYTGALEDYNKAVELDPVSPLPYHARALLYRAIKNYKNAADDFTRAINLGLTDVAVYSRRASVRKHLGDYAGAADDYTEIVTRYPECTSCYVFRGNMLERLGKKKNAALEDYKHYVALGERFCCQPELLAFAGCKIGDRRGAYENYRRALASDAKFTICMTIELLCD